MSDLNMRLRDPEDELQYLNSAHEGERSAQSDIEACAGQGLCNRLFQAFGTVNLIRADAPEEVLEDCEQLCLSLHQTFNRFDETSELSRLNACAGQDVACSEDMAAVLQVAFALYEESGRAYNVAVGPLSDLWHFEARNDESFCQPLPSDVERALTCIDASQIELHQNLETDGLSLHMPEGMRLDLGSIAKGYAVDRAAAFLWEKGACSGFLNFGGTILVLGPKPDGSPWTFGLQEATALPGQGHWAALDLHWGALAVSAGYERGALCEGRRVHHIIDPSTGYPAEHGVAETVVIAPNAMMADALSTAAFVMGPDRAFDLIHDLDAAALFRMESGLVRMIEGFPVRR